MQTPLSEGLMASIARLTVTSGDLYSTLARRLGIASTDLKLLELVVRLQAATPKSLAASLKISVSAVTAISDRLESRGFLFRSVNPNDRRSKLLMATPVGTRAQSWAEEHFRRAGAAASARSGWSAHETYRAVAALAHAMDTIDVDQYLGGAK